jgi:hypothetical protein
VRTGTEHCVSESFIKGQSRRLHLYVQRREHYPSTGRYGAGIVQYSTQGRGLYMLQNFAYEHGREGGAFFPLYIYIYIYIYKDPLVTVRKR